MLFIWVPTSIFLTRNGNNMWLGVALPPAVICIGLVFFCVYNLGLLHFYCFCYFAFMVCKLMRTGNQHKWGVQGSLHGFSDPCTWKLIVTSTSTSICSCMANGAKLFTCSCEMFLLNAGADLGELPFFWPPVREQHHCCYKHGFQQHLYVLEALICLSHYIYTYIIHNTSGFSEVGLWNVQFLYGVEGPHRKIAANRLCQNTCVKALQTHANGSKTSWVQQSLMLYQWVSTTFLVPLSTNPVVRQLWKLLKLILPMWIAASTLEPKRENMPK